MEQSEIDHWSATIDELQAQLTEAKRERDEWRSVAGERVSSPGLNLALAAATKRAEEAEARAVRSDLKAAENEKRYMQHSIIEANTQLKLNEANRQLAAQSQVIERVRETLERLVGQSRSASVGSRAGILTTGILDLLSELSVLDGKP